ncbi:hypothetical protein Esti_006553 [Eimeria stiedai]
MQRLAARPLAAAAAAATAAPAAPAAADAVRVRVAAGSGVVWLRRRPAVPFSYAALTAAATAAAAAARGRCGLASEAEGRGCRIPSEETPNPNALKFRPLLLLDAFLRGFLRSEIACLCPFVLFVDAELADSPMAAAILQVDGVESVLIGAGFVSVVKSGETDWDRLKPLVEDAIGSSTAAQLACAAEAAAAEKEEAATAAATQAEEKASAAAPLAEEDVELFESIKETLNHRVRPMLQQGDGGDLEVLRFDRERGELYVHLLGSCRGCPSSTATVKRGMEQMLRYYYPEVEAVIECDENGEPLEPEEGT